MADKKKPPTAFQTIKKARDEQIEEITDAVYNAIKPIVWPEPEGCPTCNVVMEYKKGAFEHYPPRTVYQCLKCKRVFSVQEVHARTNTIDEIKRLNGVFKEEKVCVSKIYKDHH